MTTESMHSNELLRTAHQRIGHAEKTQGAQPGKLGLLKYHAQSLEQLEGRYEREGMDPWRNTILSERRESFRQRLADFLEPGDGFGEAMPSDPRAFEVRTRIDEGVKAGRYNTEERLYLEAEAKKTEHLHRDWSSGGWTGWRKQLYLERQDAMDRLLKDYAHADHRPQGS